MKRVATIDVRPAWRSGLGTYTRCLSTALMNEPSGEFEVQPVGRAEPAPLYSLRERLWYARLRRERVGHLFHAPHFNGPWSWPGPSVVTIHDVAHLRFPPAARRVGARLGARLLIGRACARADAVIVVSHFTRAELTAIFPSVASKCFVVPNGVEPPLGASASSDEEVLRGVGVVPGFVLYLGNLRPHKNLDRLARAWRALDPAVRPPLVLAGADEMRARWALRDDPEVRRLGEVTQEQRSSLLRCAGVFAYPSLYEGFGLPPLEAMAHGTPVVCSRAAALAETTGDAALLVDATDPRAMTEGLHAALTREELRSDLIARGLVRVRRFTWAAAARETLAVYRLGFERWRRANRGRGAQP
ncbi:MAG: glycosyltransferase family 4 protein [Planctomycetota bacterium]|jgi:glycosyltransferase involved in cell wall biosynthesis